MSEIAVLVIDMLNPYGHPDADKLVHHCCGIVEPLATDHARARTTST